MAKVRITIDITYKGNDPDHTQLLDAFQDLPIMADLLTPEGETMETHVVTVETPKPKRPNLHREPITRALTSVVEEYDDTGCEDCGVIPASVHEAAKKALKA